jgi:hypothetical protein
METIWAGTPARQVDERERRGDQEAEGSTDVEDGARTSASAGPPASCASMPSITRVVRSSAGDDRLVRVEKDEQEARGRRWAAGHRADDRRGLAA